MRTVIVGRDFSTLPISSSNEKLRGWMVALSVSKKIFCLSSIFSWVTTMCVYFFGQPSLSGGPGSFGHLSAVSRTPSLSLSGSGTTVLVLEPVLVLRLVRALVVGVQDAVGVVVRIGATVLVLELVLVLGLVRALVLRVEDAVLVVVLVRATVLVLEAVPVFGIVRTLVDVVEDAVVVAVAGRLGRAAQRQVVRLTGVAIRDADVIPGAEIVALIQLGRRELDVGLGQRQLAGGALVGAAIARLLGDRAHLAHVRLELHAGAAAQRVTTRQQANARERRSPSRQSPEAHSGSDRFAPVPAGSSRSLAGVTRLDLLAASACLLTAMARARLARSSDLRPNSIAS